MISLKNTLSAIGSSISSITSSLSSITSSLGNVPHRTLLWTNSNPTAKFPAQTVYLALSNYDEVEFDYIQSYANDPLRHNISRCAVGNRTVLMFVAMLNTTMLYTDGRIVDIYTDRIVFAESYENKSASSGGHCIPYKIYGIKYGGGTA